MIYLAFTAILFCFFSVIRASNTPDSAERSRERIASLIVLPPIILGYDEIYDEPKTPAKLRSDDKPVTLLQTVTKLDKTQPRKEHLKKRFEVKSITKHPTRFNAEVQTTKDNKMRRPPVRKLNLPWQQLVAYEDPRDEDSIIIPQQRLALQRSADGKIKVRNYKINNPKHIKRDSDRSKGIVDDIIEHKDHPNKKDSNENKILTEDDGHTKNKDPTEPDDSMKNKDPTKNGDPTKNSDPTENKDFTEFDDPTKNKDLAENVDPTKNKDLTENVDPTENKEPNENDDPTEKKDLTENDDAAKINDPIENADTIVNGDPIQNKDPANNEYPTKNAHPTQNNDPTENQVFLGKGHSTVPPRVPSFIRGGDSSNENAEVALPAQGKVTDPKTGEVLNFEGKFILPNKIFEY